MKCDFCKKMCFVYLKKVIKINNSIKSSGSCSEKYYKLKECKIQSLSVE